MRAVRRPPSALLRAARVGSPSFIGGSSSFIATRHLSTPAASDLCPYGILGLAPGTQDQAKIKLQFRKLALKLHPDVVGDEASSSDQPTFVDVLAAFEILMREAEEATERRTTAPSNAARGGTAGERPRARRPGKVVQTERSLGDILCERLMEEPAAAREVWDEIVEQRLRVRDETCESRRARRAVTTCPRPRGGGSRFLARARAGITSSNSIRRLRATRFRALRSSARTVVPSAAAPTRAAPAARSSSTTIMPANSRVARRRRIAERAT